MSKVTKTRLTQGDDGVSVLELTDDTGNKMELDIGLIMELVRMILQLIGSFNKET